MDSKFELLEDMIRKRGQDIGKNIDSIKELNDQFNNYKKATAVADKRRMTKMAAEGGGPPATGKKDLEWMEGVDQEFDNIQNEVKEIKRDIEVLKSQMPSKQHMNTSQSNYGSSRNVKGASKHNSSTDGNERVAISKLEDRFTDQAIKITDLQHQITEIGNMIGQTSY